MKELHQVSGIKCTSAEHYLLICVLISIYFIDIMINNYTFNDHRVTASLCISLPKYTQPHLAGAWR